MYIVHINKYIVKMRYRVVISLGVDRVWKNKLKLCSIFTIVDGC